MTIARGPLSVVTEAELPFLEQDGNKLIRTTVRKEFSGDMVGTSEALMAAAYTTAPLALPVMLPSSTSQGRSGESRVPSSFSTTESCPRVMPSYPWRSFPTPPRVN